MQQIAVIDYGMGNLRSVSKAVDYACTDADVLVTSDTHDIANADRVVCPGQGAAQDCMLALSNADLLSVLRKSIKEKPFFGICMGMQVLLTRSDENDGVPCLDIITGSAKRFSTPLSSADGVRLKVPHMGWSPVQQSRSHPMWHGVEDHSRFYFAHSYYAAVQDDAVVAARCMYGVTIAAALATGNIFACQFHPEKSADAGLQLLRNFAQWQGN